MLRRVPTTTDGKVIDRFQESGRVNKPFKAPTLVTARAQPERKRKRVSYKGADATADDDDDDPSGDDPFIYSEVPKPDGDWKWTGINPITLAPTGTPSYDPLSILTLNV